ncbi:hypothetical protein H9S92_00265 [Lewinella lacunae]|uniref:Uncharacterized protein n=2 Tax=Neolewinella lacunae TaxID=1517758 RepID=A0A923PJR5_9BACT|nr:hypothetical protein [Neolewinella lacunae]MBC6992584.1 hypothetical protein [Neolewinella lacunae]
MNSESGVSYQLRLNSDDTNVGTPIEGTGASISFMVSPLVLTTYNVFATNTTTGCENELTDISTVSVEPALDPGTNGTLTICEGETVTAAELFASLNGTPDAGGTWTPVLAGAGTYTYTHAATANCPAVSAEVVVTEEPALDAGTNGTLTICEGETVTAAELFTSLNGTPDAGGIWTPVLAGAGTYTYTHAATANCPAVSAQVVVTEEPALDAGTNGTLTICEGETVTAAELFASLNGTPDAGGTWTPVLAGAGTYTYTHAATANCPAVSAQVVVTEEPALDAGTNGTLTICEGETVTAAELFTSLNGTPDAGGTWTPVLAGAGTYTYTHAATANCPAVSAEVVVTEEPALGAGTNGTLTICEGETVTAAELFASLGGTPDAGGTWTPVLAGAGTYTYTHAATANCPAVSAQVVVTEEPALDAGTNGTLTICEGETVTAAELFTFLNGTPDAGGTWTPVLAGAGTYTYTHAATANCPAVSAQVVVTEEPALDAGTNGTLTICEGETVTAAELFSSLGGTPDAGGTWTPVLAGAGTYTYTHSATANCPAVSAEVVVTEEPALDPGTNGTLTICEGETVTAAELFTSLNGTPDAGGTWTPVLAGAGTYTYTHSATTNCPAVSAQVVVTEELALDPGTNGTLTICEGETVTAAELFTSLGGTPDAGGTWTPVLAGAGTYTYTHAATANCPAVSAQVVVTEEPALDAGTNGTLTICEGETVTAAELFTSLNGTPDAGGTWTPVLAGAGTYTYTHAATANCPAVSAQVVVTEEPALDAGADNDDTFCAGAGAMYDLTALLSGADPGGTWVQTGGATVDISNPASVNFSSAAPGAYTFTYTHAETVNCPADASTMVINVEAVPIAFLVTGGGTYCAHEIMAQSIGLDGSQSGVNYTLFRGATSIETLPGTGAALNFTAQTTAGTYTVVATSTAGELCSSDMAGSAVIVVEDCCVTIEAFVYLEGSVIVPQTGAYALPMRTTLNLSRLLPGQYNENAFEGNIYQPILGVAGQAYNVAPWSYSGTEGIGFDSEMMSANADAGYPATVVDWVLVSLRTNPEDGDEVLCERAGLLHNDGRIEFLSDADCCQIDQSQSYYVVVEHRNHLIVMSHEAVAVVNNTITYDFRDKQSYVSDPFAAGIFLRQKEVLPGVFAMYGGNGDHVSSGSEYTDLTAADYTTWVTNGPQNRAYNLVDYNMDGDVSALDFFLWSMNAPGFTSVKARVE